MYYILKQQDEDENSGYMEIEEGKHCKGFRNWGVGRTTSTVPSDDVIIDVVPYDGYQGDPPDFSDSSIPLMSERLRKALEGAGVDNILYHPVTLKNTETGQTYPYYAFNLIGRVSMVDLKASDIQSYDGDYTGDSSIKNLVLDESKDPGLSLFRLEENFSIVIKEEIKKHLESCGIDTLKYIAPEDYYAL